MSEPSLQRNALSLMPVARRTWLRWVRTLHNSIGGRRKLRSLKKLSWNARRGPRKGTKNMRDVDQKTPRRIMSSPLINSQRPALAQREQNAREAPAKAPARVDTELKKPRFIAGGGIPDRPLR